MAAHEPNDVTTLLAKIRAGNGQAKGRLVDLVYDELHAVAANLMRRERETPSLQPTALLHEAFVRMLQGEVLGKAPDRRALFGTAVQVMRQVLADHARRRGALKRGGDRLHLPFDSLLDYCNEQKVDVVALNDALERLAQLHERASQVVTLRFLGGFSVQEVADELEVSLSTVESDYRFARAWLRKHWNDVP